MTRQETATKLRDLATSLETRSLAPQKRMYTLKAEAIALLREAADMLTEDYADKTNPDEHSHSPGMLKMAVPECPVCWPDDDATTPDRVCGFECECSPGCKTRCTRATLHGGDHKNGNHWLTVQPQLDLTVPPS